MKSRPSGLEAVMNKETEQEDKKLKGSKKK